MRHMLSIERDAATVRVRDVLTDALAFDAAAVAMAHNHPSGDPTPSADDHLFTRRLSQRLLYRDTRPSGSSPSPACTP